MIVNSLKAHCTQHQKIKNKVTFSIKCISGMTMQFQLENKKKPVQNSCYYHKFPDGLQMQSQKKLPQQPHFTAFRKVTYFKIKSCKMTLLSNEQMILTSYFLRSHNCLKGLIIFMNRGSMSWPRVVRAEVRSGMKVEK